MQRPRCLRPSYDEVPLKNIDAAVLVFLAICIAIHPVVKRVRHAATGFPVIAHFKQSVLSDFRSIIAVCHVPEDCRVVPYNG